MDQTVQIEAAAFRRLLEHLDSHKEVQNIELMNLAHFCRNCLAKWYVAAATEQGLSISYEAARETCTVCLLVNGRSVIKPRRRQSSLPHLRRTARVKATLKVFG